MTDPASVGMTSREQETEDPAPVKVHDPPPGVNVTAPVGAIGTAVLSVTVAVHVECWLAIRVDGKQSTSVAVVARTAADAFIEGRLVSVTQRASVRTRAARMLTTLFKTSNGPNVIAPKSESSEAALQV